MKKNMLLAACACLLMAGLPGCDNEKNYVTREADIADGFPLKAEDAGENPQLAITDGPYAVFHTTAGEITVVLYPDQAPQAVDNFIQLAKQGYYNGSPFHYVAKDSIVQTGKPLNGKEESSSGEAFADEYDDQLHHFHGALAMANKGIDTNESQFYFVASQKIPEDARLIPANFYMNELIRQGSMELNEKNKNNQMSEKEIADYEAELNGRIQAISTDGVPEAEMKRYQKAIDTYLNIGGSYYLDYSHTVFGQVIKGLNVVDALSQVHVDVEKKPKQDIMIERIEVKDTIS